MPSNQISTFGQMQVDEFTEKINTLIPVDSFETKMMGED